MRQASSFDPMDYMKEQLMRCSHIYTSYISRNYFQKKISKKKLTESRRFYAPRKLGNILILLPIPRN
jgi:hypothetical protein